MKRKLISLMLVLGLCLPTLAMGAYEPVDFATEELALPLTDTPVTMTQYKTMDATKIAPTTDDYATVACYRELEKLTGVKIDFVIPPIGQETEKFNLMLASDVLPDIIFHGWGNYVGGAQKAIDDGIILDLTDIIMEHCPNIRHLIETNEDIRKQISTDSGALYVFPYLKLNQEINSVFGFQLRADWLAELGLSVPETMDEWHAVLTAFKEKGTNEAGETIVPLVSRKMSYGNSAVRRFANAYGTDYDFYQMDGKVQYGPFTEGYKEYLKTMQTWYAEGLIDVEFATSDEAIHDAKVTSGIAGAWCSGLGSGMGKYITAFDKDDSKVAGTKYPVLEAGQPMYSNMMDQPFDGGTGAAISTSCKDPVLAAKWLDFQYSYQGHMLMNWGIEGESYTLDDDGIPSGTDMILNNPDGHSIDIALGLYSMGSASSSYYQDPLVRTMRMWNYEAQRETSRLWNEGTSMMLPPLTYSDAEASELSAIVSEVNTYRDEMFMKFVLGTESLDNYDAYIAQLKNMGVERAIEIRQAALDRFNER